MEKPSHKDIKTIKIGVVSSALFYLLYVGVPAMMAWIATVAAYLAGYRPHWVVVIGGLVLLIFLGAMYLLRIQIEKHRQAKGELHPETSQALQTVPVSAADVEKLENLISRLEQEKATLVANGLTDAETIKEHRGRIEELESQVDIHRVHAAACESQMDVLEIRYGWLKDVAEKEWKALHKYVVVDKCTISVDNLLSGSPYMMFDFHVFNGSVYTISVNEMISGEILFNGMPLEKEARFVPNQMKNCASGERISFKIRQSLYPDEPKRIAETLKESGNLFDFSELIVLINITDGQSKSESARLDLTRGMQHADLENKIVVLENGIQKERRAADLSVIITAAQTLHAQLVDEQIISAKRLAIWRHNATDVVAHHFGDDVANRIFGGGDYTPPNNIPEQRQWLSDYTKKLGDLPQSSKR